MAQAPLARPARMGLIVLLLGALAAAGRGAPAWQERLEVSLTGKQPIVLYFATPDATYLVPEVRRVDPERATPLGILSELARGPARDDLRETLPRAVHILDAQVADGVAVVSFSRDLAAAHGGGSAGEIFTVYSIVNTLTERPGIRAVRILLEGQPVESLSGHVDLSGPLRRDERLIRRGPRG